MLKDAKCHGIKKQVASFGIHRLDMNLDTAEANKINN